MAKGNASNVIMHATIKTVSRQTEADGRSCFVFVGTEFSTEVRNALHACRQPPHFLLAASLQSEK
jgi:hypothetical protein